MPSIAEFRRNRPDVVVTSVGGSVFRPNRLNQDFANHLIDFWKGLLADGITPVAVVGGGGQARKAIYDLKAVNVTNTNNFDRIGIQITELNAMMLEAIGVANNLPIHRIEARQITDLGGTIFECGGPKRGEVYVMGGTEPKQTTDMVATRVAVEACLKVLWNVSEVSGIFPRDKHHKLMRDVVIPSLTWDEYSEMIPKKVKSGMHVPFDPIATNLAMHEKMTVIMIGGKDSQKIFDNFRKSLNGEEFVGTVIHP
jgi:uridylate kinase